jgi:DNA-binding Lrp family transcriptional regulator
MKKNRLVIDDVDAALIRALQEDARQSLRAISRRAGSSVPTLSLKLQRLIETGAIRGFTAVIDSETFGFHDYLVEIEHRPGIMRELEKYTGEFSHCLTTQDSRVVGIFSGREKDVVTLYSRLSSVKGVERISITPTISYQTNTMKPEVEGGAKMNIHCYYCKGEIGPSPVTVRAGVKTVYLCCSSCKKLYLEKIARLQG